MSEMNLPTSEPGVERVEQRHIQNPDIGMDRFGDAAPFVYDHLIVPSQPVYRFYYEQVAAFQFFDQAQIIGALEIFSAFMVAKNVFAVYC